MGGFVNSCGTHVGSGWTFSGYIALPRLSPLYQPLQPMASCARVVQCAEAVPTLLEAFFSAVTQVSWWQRQEHYRGLPCRA